MGYLSRGRRRQHISIDGQAVALLQDLPNLLVKAHWYSVDSSVQPASPQPLALPVLPVQLSICWTRAHWGQDPTGGRGAAAALWSDGQVDTVRTCLMDDLLIFNLIPMYGALNVFSVSTIRLFSSVCTTHTERLSRIYETLIHISHYTLQSLCFCLWISHHCEDPVAAYLLSVVESLSFLHNLNVLLFLFNKLNSIHMSSHNKYTWIRLKYLPKHFSPCHT